jgi:hypothetical protein
MASAIVPNQADCRITGQKGIPRMQVIDLSATIAPSRPDALPFERIEINCLSHAEGASQIETMLQVPPDLLRNDEGWAVEEFIKLW